MEEKSFKDQFHRFAQLSLSQSGILRNAEQIELEMLKDEIGESSLMMFLNGIHATKNILVGDTDTPARPNVRCEMFGDPRCFETMRVWKLYLKAVVSHRRVTPTSLEALQKDLALFYVQTWYQDIRPPSEPAKDEKEQREFLRLLQKPVSTLDLSVRGLNVLDGYPSWYEQTPIRFIGDLVQETQVSILQRKNCGRKTLHEYKMLLEEFGLCIGMQLDTETKIAYDDWRAQQL